MLQFKFFAAVERRDAYLLSDLLFDLLIFNIKQLNYKTKESTNITNWTNCDIYRFIGEQSIT